jgi:ornithine carbamoyltransferase
MRDFLTIDAVTPEELHDLLDDADAMKADRRMRDDLAGRSIGLLFERPSTRTRVSFEVAVHELGGHPLTLDATTLQLARGESVEDTARVLSAYLHALVVRTPEHGRLESLAAAADIPVVNGLSDFAHPCQGLADLQTIREYKGALHGLKLAYLGDGNNVANALLRGGALAGMHVAVGSPAGYEPIPQVVEVARKHATSSGGSVVVTANPIEAARDADVVYTDTWVSAGMEAEADARRLIFRPFQVGYHVLEAAKPDAIVMHCLPARRDEEIAADVLDGGQSVVWAQSENRLHTAKALLRLVLREG